jgi:putative Ca2+/H+ antiporter (TMEM165/GDT1 family)
MVCTPGPGTDMDALLASIGLVAVAEIGDKTQLLSLMLAARYRQPWPIAAGVLLATLANHGLAGALGHFVAGHVPPDYLRWGIGLSFLGLGIWALFPDDAPDEPSPALSRWGCFIVSLVAFFLAEMGDRTQFATIALGARFDSLTMVVVGTTIGMMLANGPAIWLGARMGHRLPLRLIRALAGLMFAAMGLWVIIEGIPAF